jgi:hypothetical protein
MQQLTCECSLGLSKGRFEQALISDAWSPSKLLNLFGMNLQNCSFVEKVRSWQGDGKPPLSPVLSLGMPATPGFLNWIAPPLLENAQTPILYAK